MIPPETRTIAPSVVMNGWLGDTFWRTSEHLSEIVFLNDILARFFQNSDAFVACAGMARERRLRWKTLYFRL